MCNFDDTTGGTWAYDEKTQTLTFSRKVTEGLAEVETLVGTGPPGGPIKGTWSATETSETGEFELVRDP